MSPKKRQRCAGSACFAPPRSPESARTDGIVGLINSVVVTVGCMYELTGSLLGAAVAGAGLTVTLVGLVLGLRR
jgi:hypothetical protein